MMTAARQLERMRHARDHATPDMNTRRRIGLSRWEHESASSTGNGRISAVVAQWEMENRPAWRKALSRVWQTARTAAGPIALFGFAFALGFAMSSGPQSASTNVQLRQRLYATNNALTAREGELELTRLELGRLNTVMENSKRYRIPADLSAKIYDIALAEGIDPKVAFSLVNVESEFTHRAISSKGALGLTQLMPSTARFFDPKLDRSDLFDPDTNLRIGFRFLRELIGKYNGDVDLALHAYNRGPGTVDRVVERGGNPANGYAAAVMKGAR